MIKHENETWKKLPLMVTEKKWDPQKSLFLSVPFGYSANKVSIIFPSNRCETRNSGFCVEPYLCWMWTTAVSAADISYP